MESFAQRSPDSMPSNVPSSDEKLTPAGDVDRALSQTLDIETTNIETATRQPGSMIACAFVFFFMKRAEISGAAGGRWMRVVKTYRDFNMAFSLKSCGFGTLDL
jgi:hypothetical protein